MLTRRIWTNSIQGQVRLLGWLAPQLVLGFALVIAANLVSACAKDSSDQPKLEIYDSLPPFAFSTQENLPFSREDLLGKVSIANFIFTRCPTVCPVFSMKMQRVAERTEASIQLLSFSVDPGYDTPERLKAYAATYSADPARWHFLTGDPKQIRDTVEGAMKISMAEEGIGEGGVPDIVHGVHFVLIDSEGRIRGYYNSDDVQRIDELVRDATYLAKQSAKSK